MFSSIALSLIFETGFLSGLGAHQLAMLVDQKASGICLSPGLSSVGDYRCMVLYQLLCRCWRSEPRFFSLYISSPYP